MQPDTFCFVWWIGRKWREQNIKLHTKLHCSTINWSYHSIFIHFQRMLNLLQLQMTTLEGRMLWVTIFYRIITLQNFVMEVPRAFTNIPTEQKYVCFPLYQKAEISHTQRIYISKSVLRAEMVLWSYILKSILMALGGKRRNSNIAV